ncbi:hypothetical protein IAU60_001899 [Kwoniella sp. DSM 27419]
MDSCTNSTCNPVVGSPNLFTGKVIWYSYEYEVNEVSAKVFMGLFCAVTALQILSTVYWRKWNTLFTICLGGALEAIGWGGRYWSATTTFWTPTDGGAWDTNVDGFTMQIVCLIIAPTFFSAANYILLGSLVRSTGSGYSSITPSSFAKMFTAADFICLLIQCIGGGMVGTTDTEDGIKSGLNVMAVGVIAQVAVTAIFSILFAEFAWRWIKDRPARRPRDLLFWTRIFTFCFKRRKQTSSPAPLSTPSSVESGNGNKEGPAQPASLDTPLTASSRTVAVVAWALLASNILIAIRSIYRIGELLGYDSADHGSYADQNMFLGFDAVPMLVLLVVYVVVHPGRLDGRRLF